MNIQKPAYKKISSHARKIVKLNGKIAPGFDEEVIHKMRTGVKKIRALSSWFGISDIVITGYLKKSYRTAGKIREGQLLIKKIAEMNNVPPGLILWLDSYLEKMEKKWVKLYDESKIKEWEKSLEEKLKNEIIKPNTFFYENKMEQLMHIKNEYPLKDETIHKGRKLIKDIQYVHDWQEKEKIPTEQNLPLEELMKLSDEAGNFMDITNDVHLLRVYIENEKDEEARNEAKGLLENWEKEIEISREKLAVAFKSI